MSKCHDKMTNKNAKNLNVNNHGKGAVGQKNRVLPGASKVGVGGIKGSVQEPLEKVAVYSSPSLSS